MIFRQIGMVRLLLSTFIILILCLNMTTAAVISGTIYDLALEKEYDVVVEIDTIPQQLMVSKDGYYSFNVNAGNYTLYAYTALSESSEPIIITDDGEYILDIVLEGRVLDPANAIPLIDSDIDVSSSAPNNTSRIGLIILWVLIGIIILIAMFFISHVIFARLQKNYVHVKNTDKNVAKNATKNVASESEAIKEVDEYETKILSIIKKEKRTTQKDIRKEIPLSEAKISLILTDLEYKGKIRKIKKGRGNVLIFIKD